MKLAKIARWNVTRQARRSNLLAGVVDSVQTSLSSLLGGHVYVSGELLLDSGRTVDRITDTEAIDSTLPRIDSFVASVRTRSRTSATLPMSSTSVCGNRSTATRARFRSTSSAYARRSSRIIAVRN